MIELVVVLIPIGRESVEGKYVPNAGFLEDVVFADPASFQTSDDAADSLHDQHTETNNKRIGDSVDAVNDSSLNQVDSGSGDAAEEAIASGVAELKVSTDNSSADVETAVEDQHPLSTEDVDLLLEKCLLQALHTTVKDKDLPMPGSTLW